jgi:hypothetical protein
VGSTNIEIGVLNILTFVEVGDERSVLVAVSRSIVVLPSLPKRYHLLDNNVFIVEVTTVRDDKVPPMVWGFKMLAEVPTIFEGI